MSDDTKPDKIIELAEKVAKLEEKFSNLEKEADRNRVAVQCHTHRFSEDRCSRTGEEMTDEEQPLERNLVRCETCGAQWELFIEAELLASLIGCPLCSWGD